jgi:hypothetical protein
MIFKHFILIPSKNCPLFNFSVFRRIYITRVKLRKLLKLFISEGENEVNVHLVCQDAYPPRIDFTFFTFLLFTYL